MKVKASAFLVLCLTALAGCSSGGSASHPSGTAVWGINLVDTPDLNPFVHWNEGYFVFYNVYDSLTQPGSQGGTVAPDLATSWKETTPTSWTFQLRHDVRFSNGRPMVADDVVTSFNNFISGKIMAFILGSAIQATAQGDYAVKFDLSQPDEAFPSKLELMYVLPGKELTGGTLDLSKQAIGTGPYTIKDHTQSVSWTLTANPNYWQTGLPHIQTLVIRLINDPAALDAALRGGTVDIEQPGTIDAAKALAGSNIGVKSIPTTDFYALQINAIDPLESAFKDQRVRQAVLLAIDRRQIINLALGGNAQVTGLPTATFVDGCDVTKMPFAKRDLVQARTLMQAAGVTSITTNLLISPTTGAVAAPEIAQIVKANLADIGITANIVNEDLSTWINDALLKPHYSMTVNWQNGGADPTVDLDRWKTPANLPYLKGWLADDPTLDSQINQAEALARSDSRTALFNQICQRIATDANWIPIVTKPIIIAYRSDHIKPVFPSVSLGNPWIYMSQYQRA